MSIDLDIDSELPLNLSEWLQHEEVGKLQRLLEERITHFLFSHDLESSAFQRMIIQLAWIGSSDRSALKNAVTQLDLFQEEPITQCGLKKQATKIVNFIKKYKKEILIAIALVAAAVAIGWAAGYSLSLAFSKGVGADIIIAGANSIFSEKKEKPNRHIPQGTTLVSESDLASIQPPSTLPPLELPASTDEVLITSEGIWANGEFFETTAIHDNSQFAKEISLVETYQQQVLANRTEPVPQSAPSDVALTPEPKPQNRQFIDFIEKKLTEVNDAQYTEQFTKWQTGNLAWIPQKDTPTTSVSFSIPGTQNASSHIGWINGVNNTFDMSKEHAMYLQGLSNGHTICGVYNCSHGLLVDLAEAFLLNYNGYSPNTAELLQNQWRNFHQTNIDNPNAKFLQVCHSQGAIDVRNALEQSPSEIQDRVIVVAIAPGAIVPKRLCFQSFNYASERDIVYKFSLQPSLEEGSIDDVLVPRFSEMPSGDRDELILLTSHPEAEDGIDHEFQSPTFKPVLEKRIEEYNQRRGEYLPQEKSQ